MSYDRLIESQRLIAQGVPDAPFRLSRRRRFIPAAVDVAGDVAATMFIRRGVSGNPWLETWTLERRHGVWSVLGGGGGDGHDDLFEPRDELDDAVTGLGHGWTLRSRRLPLPGPARGIGHAQVRLGPAVAALQLPDRRIEVPPSGLAVVVWKSRRPPNVVAVAADDEPIAPVPLGRSVEPLGRSLRSRFGRLRRSDGWFAYSPGRWSEYAAKNHDHPSRQRLSALRLDRRGPPGGDVRSDRASEGQDHRG